jgi:hypothetical protein
MSKLVAVLILLVINLGIGGACFDYVLYAVFGKDIPWYGDAIAGLFLGEFSIPAAVIVWIIRLCGVAVPFVG